MNFVSIDVETANADMGSICQIGIAKFVDGQLVGEWASLVDPEDYFDGMNVSIHGIDSHMVIGKPKLPELHAVLESHLDGAITVCHTHFDRVAVGQALGKYSLPPFANSWLDSARVVRRTWQDLAWKGYGLANVCKRIGYEFKHHDALEDAKAAGFVLLAALQHSNQTLDMCLERLKLPIDLSRSSDDVSRQGNQGGDLYGETLVFTGSLQLLRAEAADLAASVGCGVDNGVTKRTTLLVVGDQDVTKLNGHDKSGKHRKAEELIAAGQKIRIIRETDFRALVASSRATSECGSSNTTG